MITFLKLGTHGRLGNQLFQYAALKSLGLKNNYTVKIPNPKSSHWHGQDCLLDNFNLECEYLEEKDLKTIEHIYHEPNVDVFDTNFWSIPNNTTLHGFFQSTKYFTEFEKQIRKELTLNEKFLEPAKKYIKELKEKNNNKEVVSIHFRRGDHTDGTAGTDITKYYDKDGNMGSNTICGRYVNEGMSHFDKDKHIFLLFAGGSRSSDDTKEDVNWLKNNLKGSNFYYSENRTTLEDFALIQSCDHNIMSHCSSFSWWAAYLNNNPNKKVIAPIDYLMEAGTWVREAFYPKNFILI